MNKSLNIDGIMSQLREIPEHEYKELNSEIFQEVIEVMREKQLKRKELTRIKIQKTENSWLFSTGFGLFNYQFFLQLKECCNCKDMTDDAFVKWYNSPKSILSSSDNLLIKNNVNNG